MQKKSFGTAIGVTWGVLLLCFAAIAILVKVYLIDNGYNTPYWVLLYALPVLIPALVFIMLLYNLRRAYDEHLQSLRNDTPLARWQYNEDEWSRFNRVEWEKSRKRSLVLPAVFLILLLLFGVLDPDSPDGWIPVALPFLAVFFSLLSACLLYYSYALYRRTLTCPREVIIGSKGFLYGGYYNSWDGPATRLSGVRLIKGEQPALEFIIRVPGRSGSSNRPMRVPVPLGREMEAEAMVRRLSGEGG